jgi:SWI/SNF-related matrix-associated actin-dependent regulator of chromatin subfamily A-like protein 1
MGLTMSSDELFPYQREGAEWLSTRDRACLHDEAGLGKTWTTIHALDLVGAKRGLIICRAMLRQSWMDEHKKRAKTPRRMIKGRTIRDLNAWMKGHFDVLLLSYEMASKWAIHFATLDEILDFVVIDEAHFIRNPMAARTRMILGDHCQGPGGVIQWAEQVFHLTGTPMEKNPADAWACMQMCRVVDMPRGAFENRYVLSPTRDDIQDFRQRYHRGALRRTLATVGLQLPDIFYTQQIIEGDTKSIAQFFKDRPNLDSRIIDALDAGNLSFIDAGHLMTLRRLLAEAKAQPFAAHIIELLESGEIDKCVIMGFHVGALEAIHFKLAAAGLRGYLVNGSTSESLRSEACREFQENPDVKYFVGNSTTAGTGLTLHAAAHIFIFEAEWNPGANEQMVKRIRRIGQRRVQHARFVTLADSFDETLVQILIDKTRSIARLQSDDYFTMPDMAFKA